MRLGFYFLLAALVHASSTAAERPATEPPSVLNSPAGKICSIEVVGTADDLATARWLAFQKHYPTSEMSSPTLGLRINLLYDASTPEEVAFIERLRVERSSAMSTKIICIPAPF